MVNTLGKIILRLKEKAMVVDFVPYQNEINVFC